MAPAGRQLLLGHEAWHVVQSAAGQMARSSTRTPPLANRSIAAQMEAENSTYNLASIVN